MSSVSLWIVSKSGYANLVSTARGANQRIVFLLHQNNAKVHDIGIGRTSDQQVIEVLKKMI
jgi:hypothetical protein